MRLKISIRSLLADNPSLFPGDPAVGADMTLTFTPTQLDDIRRRAAAYAYGCGRWDEWYARALLLPAPVELPNAVDFEREVTARGTELGDFRALWDEMVAAMSGATA